MSFIRGPQENSTFIPYDYQSHHFLKLTLLQPFWVFFLILEMQTHCHDYYHSQSNSVNVVLMVLVSKYQEMVNKCKNNYHSLLPVIWSKTTKSSFKYILVLITTFKKKKKRIKQIPSLPNRVSS